MTFLKTGFKLNGRQALLTGLAVLLAALFFGFSITASAATNPDQVSDPVKEHCLKIVSARADSACTKQVDNDGNTLVNYARNAAAFSCDEEKSHDSAAKCVVSNANDYLDDAVKDAKSKSKDYSAHDFEVALRQRLDKENVNYTDSAAASAASEALGAKDPSIDGSFTCADGRKVSDKAACPECNKSKCDFIGKYVNPAINLLSVTFGLIAAISIIWGAIQYSSSGVDPQQVTKAKQRLSKTIIAVLVYLFLYAFLQFIVPGGIFNR